MQISAMMYESLDGAGASNPEFGMYDLPTSFGEDNYLVVDPNAVSAAHSSDGLEEYLQVSALIYESAYGLGTDNPEFGMFDMPATNGDSLYLDVNSNAQDDDNYLALDAVPRSAQNLTYASFAPGQAIEDENYLAMGANLTLDEQYLAVSAPEDAMYLGVQAHDEPGYLALDESVKTSDPAYAYPSV